MAMVTSTSASNANLSRTVSLKNRNNLQGASFSSYLNGTEDTFILLKLTESNQKPVSLIPAPHERVFVGRKKVEDGEIGVFGAEKYFKGAMDKETPRISDKVTTRNQHEKDEPIDISAVNLKTQPETSSVRSGSSWNSRSALLQSISRNNPRRRISKGKISLSMLGCKYCSCGDKNSVVTDENIGETSGVIHGKAIAKPPMKTGDLVRINKALSNRWVEEEMNCKKVDEGLNREDCFSFPILNSKVGNLDIQMQLQGDDMMRSSVEIFGSPILEKGKKSLSLERKITMLNWDSITPRLEEIEFPSSPTESETSSDLFEIESFSTNPHSSLARQASNGMSGCVTPTTCYAPSEASIEWSVVTASAADFSAPSDSDEMRATAMTRRPNRMVGNAKSTPGKEMQKRRPSILSGCKNQKAVRVAGDAYRTNEKAIPEPRGRHRLDSFKPVTRFQV